MDLRAAEQEANAQFAKGQIGESARTFLCLSEHLPQRLDFHAQLGYLALLANDQDAAVKYLTGVINGGLRSRQVLAHLAEAYYRQGRLGSAAFCYQRLGRDGLAATLAAMGDLDTYRLTRPGMSTELAWVTNHPLPVVPALINGRSANLMLDTGAGETVLDARFAVDVGVRLGGQEQRTFGGGMPAWVTYGHAKELLLGDLGVLDVPVHVIDMPPGLAGWFPDLPIHGILGTGVFSRFRTTLDYRSGCLRLESSDKTRDSQLQKIRQDRSGTPMWLAENQLPLACADLPAHENGVWFLDSGMTGGAFAVPASKVEALGLDAEKDAPLVGAGGGGTVQGHRVRTGWLRLDGLCRYHQEGVVLDNFPVEQSCGFAIQGLIGHDLLRNSVMTLDFPVMRLFLNEGNP